MSTNGNAHQCSVCGALFVDVGPAAGALMDAPHIMYPVLKAVTNYPGSVKVGTVVLCTKHANQMRAAVRRIYVASAT